MHEFLFIGFFVSTENITFEQPLNEHIRICLRLEFLFAEMQHFIANEASWDSRMALSALLEILGVIDRPDLKSKLGQALNQYTNFLLQLESRTNVDKDKLKQIIKQLDAMMDYLHSNQGRVGQEIRDNEFLFTIQQRLYTPAGTCGFCAPAYNLWLQQPHVIRQRKLNEWLKPFLPIKSIVEVLLKLTRESTSFKAVFAESGFYQSSLDPVIPYQMIRISLPSSLGVYPEISVGRHRLTIHFFELATDSRANQAERNIQFGLACCRV